MKRALANGGMARQPLLIPEVNAEHLALLPALVVLLMVIVAGPLRSGLL